MIVALDISTADTGIAMKDSRGGIHLHNVAPLKSQKDYTKILHVAAGVVQKVLLTVALNQRSRFRRDDECLVFVEEPFHRSGRSFPGPTYMCHGAIMALLFDACNIAGATFCWNVVNVSVWRPWLLSIAGVKACNAEGKKRPGTAEYKVAVQQALVKLGHEYPASVLNDNVADAAGIYLWAEEQMKGE